MVHLWYRPASDLIRTKGVLSKFGKPVKISKFKEMVANFYNCTKNTFMYKEKYNFLLGV